MRLGCRYLFKSTSAGVQDYLCNRLYSLPENGVEQYLLQLVQLVLTRPHSSLEKVLIDLCARSLRLAVKVGTASVDRQKTQAFCMLSALAPIEQTVNQPQGYEYCSYQLCAESFNAGAR